MLLDGILTRSRRHRKEGGHHHGHGTGAAVESRQSGGREIKIVRRVLDANDMIAGQNRQRFAAHRVFVLNLMSSPGSGKTTTLEKTLKHLMADFRCGVVVGDICTTNDADRLAASGAPVVQINTDEFGGDCHLAAHVVEKSLSGFDLEALDALIVENIGNLVCPAEFDIGEDRRVVILSVTEGEDKPLKYPLMFRECDAAILNKVDLLPYLDGFDVKLAGHNIRQVHPGMPVFELSAKTEAGFSPWLDWLTGEIRKKIG
jgi:hydrogenase nickel incorporation protein HypB